MSKIIPGFRPRRCPVCGSTFIVSGFVKGEWKRLVAPGIELKEPVRVPVYYCGECGYILSKAFLDREVTTFGPPERESYLVEDVDGVVHFLVHAPGRPVRPIYGSVEIVEARRVVPPKPMSALIVTVKAPITYRNVYCEWEYPYFGAPEAIPTGRVETVRREAKYTREYTLRHLRDFHDLIRRVRAAGYKPNIRQGVLAYLVACALSPPKYGGTKSLITGFLRASEVPEYRDTSASTVGQALSRMEKLGLFPPEFGGFWRIWREDIRAHVNIPVNRILTEKEYILRRELPDRLFRKKEWWRILEVEKRRDAPKFVGLTRWL